MSVYDAAIEYQKRKGNDLSCYSWAKNTALDLLGIGQLKELNF